jgi:hypothetical protein
LARRPERNFFEQLRRNLPKCGFPLHLQRVENTATVGTPDLNYCVAGTEGWLELKAWERVRFTGRFTVPKLRPEQAAWLAARCAAGGRAYLLARINKDVVLIDGRFVPLLYDKELHLPWEHGRTIAACWLEPPTDWRILIHKLRLDPAPQERIDELKKLFTTRAA